jgi:hypothetical protein
MILYHKPLLRIITFSILFLKSFNISAQVDSLISSKNDPSKFEVKQIIIPATLITYGIIGLESHSLLSLNSEIKHELKEKIDSRFTIDDYSQYTPTLSVYALNTLGIKGKHNLRERLIVSTISHLIMGISVNSIKSTGNVIRPDGSSNNSFPSGHTAISFVGAEFLWQEYKDVSIWYGISGYLIASGTGFFRMYNNRHWLTDVSMGAGIGILSTKIAYWTLPYVDNKLFKKQHPENTATIIYPFYNGKQTGLGLSMRL